MGSKVLVLGGNGFIGRYAVRALRECADQVVVGTRRVDPGAGYVSVRLHERTSPESWHSIIEPFDVVLNCVGILRQRRSLKGRESYEQVHHLAPAAIASACADQHKRFVHVSALGLHEQARSRFLTSKLRGEQAIKQTNCSWLIVRPSLLDGEGGYGAAWLRGVAKLPFYAIPADAKGQIAALTVEDAGLALARACTLSDEALRLSDSREFELGGTSSYSFDDYIRGLRRRTSSRRALGIQVPGWSARLGAHLCDLFHFSPFSFGHWELLRRPNVPQPNRLPELLGRAPQEVIPGPYV